MGWLDQDTSFWLLVILLSGFGACMSLLFTAVNALTVGDLDQDNSNAGSTMMSVVQQVGIGIGIAVSAVILAIYRVSLGEDALILAFQYTFLTSACFGVLLTVVVAMLHHNDGNHMNQKKHNMK